MNTPEPRIRRLAPSDSITELTDLLHRAYRRLADMGLRYLATHQDGEVTRDRVERGECWVAEIDGRIVATILFEDAATTAGCRYYDRAGVASFHQFAVEPEWQGCGIGSRLLAHVEARAAETGATEIALDTAEEAAHLIALYNRRGYCIVDHADWDETNYISVIMSRPTRAPHTAAVARATEEPA